MISFQRLKVCISVFLLLVVNLSCKAGNDSKEASSTTRSGPVGEADLKGLTQVRDDFLAVKSKGDLGAFLDKLEKQEAASSEVRYVSALAQLIRPFKGIVFKMTPVFKQTKATHSLVLSMVQGVVSGVETYLPAQQWSAVVAYLSEPSKDIGAQYNTISDAQAELERVLIPVLEQAITTIESIPMSDADPVVWDNRFIHGNVAFVDAKDRFVKIGSAEKFSTLANLSYALLAAKAACAYQLDEMPAVVAAMGRIIGVDGFIGDRITGAPLMERVNVIKQFQKFLVLKPNGAALMTSALADFRKAVDYGQKSFTEVLSRNSGLNGSRDEFWSIRPDKVMTEQRGIQLAIQELKAMAAGPASVYSLITNERTTVNIPSFFTNPPADLKVFLPTSFVTTPTRAVDGITINNYLYGSAIAWNAAAFTPYFSGVSQPQDVSKVTRIFSQSSGGKVLWVAMAGLVN